MQATVHTATIVGVEAVPVEVQADVSSGLPSFGIVGLGDTAVLEARERVRSALKAAGYDFPNARVVVNLAPAPLRKHGTGFDLPIAAALLTATRQMPPGRLDGCQVVGELALDGGVRTVAGLLAHALAARRRGLALVGPAGSAAPVAVTGLRYLPLSDLAALRHGLPEPVTLGPGGRGCAEDPDIAEVAGHEAAKRALEIAAAGGHNLLMVGPPGSGKTMLARRLPGILPPLGEEERLETALVHSVAGLDASAVLAGRRPFRAPHHTCSTAGLVGGGSPARPGEASLAHHGVLFLDEFAEFAPSALQALRQPLEDGALTIVRAEGRVRYPARFALVAAMNPCPCGHLGDPEVACRCPDALVRRYGSRVGGPLMDRLDICIRVDRVDPSRILSAAAGPVSSKTVRERVDAARARAEDGSRPSSSALSGSRLLSACALDTSSRRALVATARAARLSGRGVTRLLRVARTIADLDGCERVAETHLMEAFGYRSLEA